MNVLKRTATLILALALTVGAIRYLPLTATGAEAVKNITLQPGSNANEMNFCWQSSSGGASAVQLAVKTGGSSAFPSDAISFNGAVTEATKGYYSNKVTVTGLAPQTEYLYRVCNGTAYSGVYSFKTGNSDTYNVIFVSDAQIGASANIAADKAGWGKTLTAALGKHPGTSFLLSAGDQVDYFLESEYDAFLASPLLRQYPLATAVGNHENLGKSPLHSYYYNEPNESAVYGVTPAGGDYWFRYGSTLYLVLNTNNTNVAEHDAFLAQATASNPGVTWTILMFHHSLYSSAVYATSSSILTLRKNLVPVIDKYDIDVVLSGHDHCYTRTYQMLGGSPVSTAAASHVVNPEGTVYITANSSSGSKYYDMKKSPEAYAAVRLQLKAPTFMNIEISGNALTMTTYRGDTMAVIDTYAITKQSTSGFADVPDSAWYSAAVAFLSSRHITEGTSESTFSPDMILTRGQCLVLLMKAYGITPDSGSAGNFSDAGSTWYTGYLAAAKRLGLANGSDGKFMPEAKISRQDMFLLVYNTLVFLNKLPAGSATGVYTDENIIAPYAKDAINALTASGVITGSGGLISPAGHASRAQMAQILYNLLLAN